MSQNAISRLESPEYGKQTITTLKRLAAAMDVGLIVRLVPFSELIDWISGTPRAINGLTAAALAVPDFESEEREGVFARTLPIVSGNSRHPGGTTGALGFASLGAEHMRRPPNGRPQAHHLPAGGQIKCQTGCHIAVCVETLPPPSM